MSDLFDPERTGRKVEAGVTTGNVRTGFTAAPHLAARWKKIDRRIRAEFGEDLYSSWFARLEPEDWTDQTLTLSVPPRFLRNWIETHYAERLARICETEFSPLDKLVVKMRTRGLPTHESMPREKPVLRAVEPLVSTAASAPERVNGHDKAQGSPVDRTMTFDSFVTGRSNALALAAARRVADAGPGQPLAFNPLYIHAGSGLGKTHLLNAVAQEVRRIHPERNVLYITAERFMYHFIVALKSRDVLPFKDFFHNVDVLLIDDFQFLQGKTMQQEFCHTLASMLDAKRQVVVAADVPPGQLGSIDKRMRSRFAGGLVVDIAAPDLELRRSILRSRIKSAQHKDPGLTISEEVIEFIANRITGGGRELEGALNRIIASQQITHSVMTVDLAAVALRDLAEAGEPVRIRIDDILQVIGRHYNVSRADLLSPRRARAIVHPRQVGMYLAKKLTPRSLPEIGRRFGGRDHSTVLHAVRKIEDLLKNDDKLAREVALLIQLVEQQ